MASYAWAENAVIINDDGSNVTFHPKCPNCGTVNTTVKSNAHVGAGTTAACAVHCTKCGKIISPRFGRK